MFAAHKSPRKSRVFFFGFGSGEREIQNLRQTLILHDLQPTPSGDILGLPMNDYSINRNTDKFVRLIA